MITPLYKTYNQVVFNEDPDISNLEIPYIHVLSRKSKLYNNKNGVIDGDRIIAFGEWDLGEPISLFAKEWERSIGKQNIHISLLRPNVNSYTKIELILDSDMNESNYIEYHVSKMTNVERKFIQDHLSK